MEEQSVQPLIERCHDAPAIGSNDFLCAADSLCTLASIFAFGILRLRMRSLLTADPSDQLPPENPPNFPVPGLEVPGETVLTVPRS
jgi:hypothetical protein